MTQVFTKKDLIDKFADELELTKKASKTYVDYIFDTITDQLAEGNNVELFGFGKFVVKEKPARTGINPMTLEKVDIPASKSVSFKASSGLKDKVK